MTADDLKNLAAAWTRLGALFNVAPADRTPDVEQLLLETARALPANPTLLSVVATWLVTYGEFVDGQRLAELVRMELEPDHRPVMGFLLESVQYLEPHDRAQFDLALAVCEPAVDARPLFDVERRSALRSELARRRASPLSRRWGRWATAVELRTDVIRPRDWVVEHNPSLAARGARSFESTQP